MYLNSIFKNIFLKIKSSNFLDEKLKARKAQLVERNTEDV